MRSLIVPLFIPHAGCPHACSYCNQHLVTRGSPALPDPEQIRQTILTWHRRSPGRPVEAAFFGGSFTLLPRDRQEQLLGAVQPLIDQGIVVGIRLSTRPDGLDEGTLSFLKQYRVGTVEVGVQSLADEVLLQAGRGHGAAESLAALARLRQAGFRTGAQLMPGLPGDTADASLASLAGVIGAGAQFVRIYPAVVLAGTTLARRYLVGDWQPLDCDEAVTLCARLLLMARRAAVPVIRLGLQSDDGLVAGETVLAGPWHPALGQLVRGELYFCLVAMLRSRLAGEIAQIRCHPGRLSDVGGHGRRNLLRWQRQGIPIERVTPDPDLRTDEVMLTAGGRRLTGSIHTDLNDKEIVDAQRFSGIS